MSDAGSSCVMVFADAEDVARELLAVGQGLADQASLHLVCTLACDQNAEVPDLTREADVMVRVRTMPEGRGGPEVLLAALDQAVRAYAPAVLLLEASRDGTQIASRLAQRLGLPCASDCTSLRIEDGPTLVVERRVYGGRFLAEEALNAPVGIATVRRGRFESGPEGRSRRGVVETLDVAVPDAKVNVLESVHRKQSEQDLAGCAVVVGAGRGLAHKEDLALVERLAAALGGAVAGSRPITDQLKWLPPDRKVGLSGRTVKPNLYIACGISGQIEHVVGMSGARTVVAINKDPLAPIHSEADFSLVGDLYEIVPAMIRALENPSRIPIGDSPRPAG